MAACISRSVRINLPSYRGLLYPDSPTSRRALAREFYQNVSFASPDFGRYERVALDIPRRYWNHLGPTVCCLNLGDLLVWHQSFANDAVNSRSHDPSPRSSFAFSSSNHRITNSLMLADLFPGFCGKDRCFLWFSPILSVHAVPDPSPPVPRRLALQWHRLGSACLSCLKAGLLHE